MAKTIILTGGVFAEPESVQKQRKSYPEVMLKTQLIKRGHNVRTYSYTQVLDLPAFSDVDVVHANHIHKGTLACVLQSSAPIVYTSHNGFIASGLLAYEYASDPAYVRALKQKVRNFVLANADAVVALSTQEAVQMELLGVSKSRLAVIPNMHPKMSQGRWTPSQKSDIFWVNNGS